MNPPITDEQIRAALIQQVALAVPPGGSERDVTTIISTPMWQAWCRAVGAPEDSGPTVWGMTTKHNPVFGSRTIVCRSSQNMIAVSSSVEPFAQLCVIFGIQSHHANPIPPP